ncbi:MAG: FHA domain-containing protein [Prevotella sp.]|nr:FHA domain-containing protein [Prevotella sp.]
MKTITIGRGDGCTITIDDEMMSRRHAIIKIPTFGNMEVVDMSKNGTFVNGVRLRPNVPFPVTRKDVVNFADVYQLDWSKVPDPLKYYKLGAIIVAGLVVLILAICLVKSLFTGSEEPAPQPATEQVQKPATTIEQQAEPIQEQEQQEGEGQQQDPDASSTTSPSTPQESTAAPNDEVIDVYGAARASKKKREAEERARQQKAKELQKQKQQDSQKQKETPAPSKDNSSGNKNKTVVI